MLNESFKKKEIIVSLWILLIILVFGLLFTVYNLSYWHAEAKAYNNKMSLYYETKMMDFEDANTK